MLFFTKLARFYRHLCKTYVRVGSMDGMVQRKTALSSRATTVVLKSVGIKSLLNEIFTLISLFKCC